MVVIEFRDFSVSYSTSYDPDRLSKPVLDHINCVIDEGDLALLIGHTGCGKTTFLRSINGLVPYFSGGYIQGDLIVDGHSIRDQRPRDLAQLIGFVGQNPAMGFVTDRVEDEIVYGLEQIGIAPHAMRKRVEETLDVMGIAELRDRSLIELSGGQQQRVAIAAVLAAQPRVLVLDEPTSALDPTVAQEVLGSIVTLVDDVGLTVVVAEHRLERVMHMADSAIWLPGDGSARMGSVSEIFSISDITPPLSAFSQAMGWPICTSVRDARRRLREEKIEISAAEPPHSQCHGQKVVHIENLCVSYGETMAVRQASFDVDSGQVVGLMGRNGAGKSSLLWALQTVQPSRGVIEIDGRNPQDMAIDQLTKIVAMVPQTAQDLLYLATVDEELAQADKESLMPAGSARKVLEQLGVDLPGQRSPLDLSEGQKLALVLAIQMVSRPKVLLLDEPTRGLDYAMKDQLARMIFHFRDQGTAVLIATHDVEFAAKCCSRIILMAQGEVIADGSTHDILTSSMSFAPQITKICYPVPVLRLDDVMAITKGNADE